MPVVQYGAVLTCIALLLPGSLAAQDAAASGAGDEGWFPSEFVVQPLTGARSGIDVGTGPLYVRRDPPAGSGAHGPEADASFGYRFPIYRFSDGGASDSGLDLGIEAGMIARFALGEVRNGLINSDFRVAFPFGADFGRWESTLALVHVSSHAGDDFIDQTPGFEPRASSRNGVEGIIAYRADRALRLFARGDWNWAAVGLETVGGRLGALFDPGDDGGARPVGSLELQVNDFNSGVGVTGMVGLGLRTGTGDVRLGLVGHAGPSDMGQFRAFDEEYVGLFLSLVPELAIATDAPEI